MSLQRTASMHKLEWPEQGPVTTAVPINAQWCTAFVPYWVFSIPLPESSGCVDGSVSQCKAGHAGGAAFRH